MTAVAGRGGAFLNRDLQDFFLDGPRACVTSGSPGHRLPPASAPRLPRECVRDAEKARGRRLLRLLETMPPREALPRYRPRPACSPQCTACGSRFLVHRGRCHGPQRPQCRGCGADKRSPFELRPNVFMCVLRSGRYEANSKHHTRSKRYRRGGILNHRRHAPPPTIGPTDVIKKRQ